jgi:hypothetical protein
MVVDSSGSEHSRSIVSALSLTLYCECVVAVRELCKLVSHQSAGIRDEPKSNECTWLLGSSGSEQSPITDKQLTGVGQHSSSYWWSTASCGQQRHALAVGSKRAKSVDCKILGALSHSLILSSLMHALQKKGAVRVLCMLFSSSISPNGVE